MVLIHSSSLTTDDAAFAQYLRDGQDKVRIERADFGDLDRQILGARIIGNRFGKPERQACVRADLEGDRVRSGQPKAVRLLRQLDAKLALCGHRKCLPRRREPGTAVP